MSRRSSRSQPEAEAEDSVDTPDADAVAAMVDDAEDEIENADAVDDAADEVLDANARIAEIRERLEQLVTDRPLLTLGIAVGVGFAIARLFRR